jgi:hypothetical protein
MIINARAWPHPVLSPMTDDIVPAQFDFALAVEADYDRWRLKVSAQLMDGILKGLIAAQKADYVLHLECRRTFYRAAFRSTVPDWEITIPGAELYGLVEASFLVIAVADLDTYTHPGQHSDYGGNVFALGIGEPLAVAETRMFEAFNEPDSLRKLSSIVNIRRGGDDLRLLEINCEDNRIIATLPPQEYHQYCQLRGGETMAGVLANAVVLPALIQSFHYLRRLDGMTLSEFAADHHWARLVLPRLEQLNVQLFDQSDDGSVCLTAAQELLRGPLRRSLEDLVGLIETPD